MHNMQSKGQINAALVQVRRGALEAFDCQFPQCGWQPKVEEAVFDLFPRERRPFLQFLTLLHNNTSSSTNCQFISLHIRPLMVEPYPAHMTFQKPLPHTNHHK
jgi:hypothetical protein